jgi:hypothetical protein
MKGFAMPNLKLGGRIRILRRRTEKADAPAGPGATTTE